MSIKAMVYVWQMPYKSPQKLMLLAIADRCDDEGICFPGVSTLAKKCSIGDRGPHSKTIGPAIVTRVMGNWRDIRYEDGSTESGGYIYLSAYVDPKDAEIAELKAQLTAAKEWSSILQKSNDTLQTTIDKQTAVTDLIRKIEPDDLSPIEALVKLYELKLTAGKA